MIGAIIGDVAGSRYERTNHKSKEFELFDKKCRLTDDSVMSLAVAKAILDCNGDFGGLCLKYRGTSIPDAAISSYLLVEMRIILQKG